MHNKRLVVSSPNEFTYTKIIMIIIIITNRTILISLVVLELMFMKYFFFAICPLLGVIM